MLKVLSAKGAAGATLTLEVIPSTLRRLKGWWILAAGWLEGEQHVPHWLVAL